MKVAIPDLISNSYFPVAAAVELGFFKAEGLDVEFVGFKTAAQMIAIPCLLLHRDVYGVPVVLLGQVLIVIAAILTVWSMLYYLRRAWPVILEKSA